MLNKTLKIYKIPQYTSLLQRTIELNANLKTLSHIRPYSCLCGQVYIRKSINVSRDHSTRNDHRQKAVIETTTPKIVYEKLQELPNSSQIPTIENFWRDKVDPYVKLARWDKPIGIYLLYWPCAWSIALASIPGTVPLQSSLQTAALFLVGAGLMRGAGCTINDLWDRDVDAKVERTKTRPLVTGAVSETQAVIFLAAQLSLALGILLQLNCYSILLGASSMSFPYDSIISKLDDGVRYQYMLDGNGIPHLVDLWGTTSDLVEASRYNPDAENVYHLFTRLNPTVSQPMVLGNKALLSNNFDPKKKTVILIHGWIVDINGILGTNMIPALLAGADVNVIAVDWYAGAGSINYFAAVRNTEPSGVSVAKFITWLNLETGASLSNYFLIGHSLGGHQVGIVGRNLGGQVPYILSIDPASPGWNFKPERFQKTDGIYTEVIHSNAGLMGYLVPLGDVDIYPNGGIDMPGCITPMCSHDKAVYYIAESMASGGFTAQECSSFFAAIRNKCNLPGSLKMGGLEPKTGISGVYRVDTNAFSPYSMG